MRTRCNDLEFSLKYLRFLTFFLVSFLGLSVLVFGVYAHENAKPAKTYQKLSKRKLKKLSGWKTYKNLCADCHGEKGDGKGPLAETMNPAPANYQNCDVLSKVSDEDIKKVIMEGTQAIGKSAAMQGFKKKIKDPAVLDLLIEVVRSFGGCNYSPEE